MPLLHKAGLDPSGVAHTHPDLRRAVIDNEAVSVGWITEIECTGRSGSETSWKACT